MTRDDAISLLVERDLARLSVRQRADTLLGWWHLDDSDAEHAGLPEPLKQAMANDDEPRDPESALHDPLLRLALRSAHVGVTNAYLRDQVAALGHDEPVHGQVEALEACPCCGYRSLGERGAYEICGVCFWEDDGGADPQLHSGPNHMTLREGRLNFERIGAVSEAHLQHVFSDGRARFAYAGAPG